MAPDGTPITGGTTATYTVAAGDQGKVLSVQVTASKAGFVTVSATSAATSAVAPQPQVCNTALPTVSDPTPEVGQVLTASDGTWTPSGVAFAYQWRSDGTDIGGAISKTFQVPAGQLGKKLPSGSPRRGPSISPARDLGRDRGGRGRDDPLHQQHREAGRRRRDPGGRADLTASRHLVGASGLAFTYQWLADNVASAAPPPRRTSWAPRRRAPSSRWR